MDSLQQKVFHLETLLKNSKYPFSELLKSSEEFKMDQQEIFLKSADLTSNDRKVNLEVKKPRDKILERFSKDSKINFKTSSNAQQY